MAPGGRRNSREVRKTVQSKTKNGQTPPVCPFAFILRQHRTIASATFSGAFTLEIRYFFLKYTKYSCEKLTFSTAKSPAECSCRIMRYCLISILSKNKELAQILKRMDSCTFMPSILLRSGELKRKSVDEAPHRSDPGQCR